MLALIDSLIAGAAVVIALVSLGVSTWTSRKGYAQSERSQRAAYEERVRVWADDTIELIIGIGEVCRKGSPQTGFEERLDVLRTGLSAQIEKGRWFFPNYLEDRVGGRKEAAYRGIRQPILDYLVFVYRAVDDLTWEGRTERVEEIRGWQRAFVSDVQHRLDPRQRAEAYKDLLRRFEAIDRLVDE